MASVSHDDIVLPRINRGEIHINNAARNALRLVGFDLTDVSQDRPLPPDGLKILADLWIFGASVPEIMQELNLSEARASGDLVYLELKGKVQGFVACMFEGRMKG